MKQHITIAQLNELSSEMRVKLNKEWRNDGKIVNLLDQRDINIGQMIEFLEEHEMRYVFAEWANEEIMKNETPLCDYLWESVKEVLEKE